MAGSRWAEEEKGTWHLENASRHEGKAGDNKLLEGYPLTTMLCKYEESLKGLSKSLGNSENWRPCKMCKQGLPMKEADPAWPGELKPSVPW